MFKIMKYYKLNSSSSRSLIRLDLHLVKKVTVIAHFEYLAQVTWDLAMSK